MNENNYNTHEELARDTLILLTKYVNKIDPPDVINIIVSTASGTAFAMCKDEGEVKTVLTLAVNNGLIIKDLFVEE